MKKCHGKDRKERKNQLFYSEKIYMELALKLCIKDGLVKMR